MKLNNALSKERLLSRREELEQKQKDIIPDAFWSDRKRLELCRIDCELLMIKEILNDGV